MLLYVLTALFLHVLFMSWKNQRQTRHIRLFPLTTVPTNKYIFITNLRVLLRLQMIVVKPILTRITLEHERPRSQLIIILSLTVTVDMEEVLVIPVLLITVILWLIALVE